MKITHLQGSTRLTLRNHVSIFKFLQNKMNLYFMAENVKRHESIQTENT